MMILDQKYCTLEDRATCQQARIIPWSDIEKKILSLGLALPLLADYFNTEGVTDSVVDSPDFGSTVSVEAIGRISQTATCGLIFLCIQL